MGEEAAKVPAVPAIGVSYSVAIPGERNLVFQTHIDQAASVEQCNALVDKLLKVSDRTLAKYSLPALEEHIIVEKAQLAKMEADVTRIDALHAGAEDQARASGRRVAPKISEQERQQRLQTVEMVTGYRGKVARLEAKYAELREQVNGPDVPADR